MTVAVELPGGCSAAVAAAVRDLWTAYEGDRFAVTELGTGGEGILVVLGIDLLRHAGDELGLAPPRRRPCPQARSPSQPIGRT
jgi:hypothetical protein